VNQKETKGITPEPEFALKLEERSGIPFAKCYQCGKCSAGCPAAYEMDLLPHLVIRLVQLGRQEKVLDSKAIWLCVSCQTCLTRCPNEIDLPHAMDTLRQLALKQARHSGLREVKIFHRAFLFWVEKLGRVYEPGLIGMHKALSLQWFSDLLAAPKMLLRMKLFPHRIKGQKAVARIFEKTRQDSKEAL
jgi:heterodisulfide reductase subunit C2